MAVAGQYDSYRHVVGESCAAPSRCSADLGQHARRHLHPRGVGRRESVTWSGLRLKPRLQREFGRPKVSRFNAPVEASV